MSDINKLKELRQQTGVSYSLCKKALEESKNDIAAAKKLLSKWAGKELAEKQQKSTMAGALFSYVHHNRKVVSVVELLCETDFVSGNSEFHTLGSELAKQVASLPTKTSEELITQVYIRDSSKKVSDLLKEAVLKFGENIKIGRFMRWELGETK